MKSKSSSPVEDKLKAEKIISMREFANAVINWHIAMETIPRIAGVRDYLMIFGKLMLQQGKPFDLMEGLLSAEKDAMTNNDAAFLEWTRRLLVSCKYLTPALPDSLNAVFVGGREYLRPENLDSWLRQTKQLSQMPECFSLD